MLDILRTIICYEFDRNVGRMQWKQHLDEQPMYGLEMNFCLREKNCDDPLYPNVQLLIYAASNYVGVYYRESQTCDDYGEWQHLSCHDSCWKDDGVGHFIRLYKDRITTLDWHDGICNNMWYSKQEISQELAEHLRKVTKQARNNI